MSNRGGKSGSKSGLFGSLRDMGENLTKVLNTTIGALSDIGKILAGALKSQPILAAIVLVLVVAAFVTIVTAIFLSNVIYAFFVLALVLLLGLLAYLFLTELRKEKEHIRTTPKVRLDMNRDTFSLINQLDDAQKQNILAALRGAASGVARTLRIPTNLVRSNLFCPDNQNRMRIIPGFTHNMNRPEELGISMPIGYGSTGRCFQSGKPNIAVFREGWGKNVIEDRELQKVHPDLQWIVSVPILGEVGKLQPLGVLNVDGLQERRTEVELQQALSQLFNWSQMLSLIVARGLNG